MVDTARSVNSIPRHWIHLLLQSAFHHYLLTKQHGMDLIQFNESIDALYNHILSQGNNTQKKDCNKKTYHDFEILQIKLDTRQAQKSIMIWLRLSPSTTTSTDIQRSNIEEKEDDCGIADYELNLVITYSVSYMCPILHFRLFKITVECDEEMEFQFETKRLTFQAVDMETFVNRKRNGNRYKQTSPNPKPPLLINSHRIKESKVEDIDEYIENNEYLVGEDSKLKDESSTSYGLNKNISADELIVGDSSMGTYYFIHPCNTTQFMEELGRADDGNPNANKNELFLLEWWGFYSRVLL